jgi:hypothetical protein
MVAVLIWISFAHYCHTLEPLRRGHNGPALHVSYGSAELPTLGGMTVIAAFLPLKMRR